MTDLAENAHSEIESWQNNRHLYPGWLVAPRSVRDHIWLYTRNWQLHILRSLDSVATAEKLRILFELNWRLEVALIPLTPEATRSISDCLETVYSPEGLLREQEAAGGQHTLPGDRTPALSHDIRDQWVALAFAILRFHREERQDSEFTKWAQRINSVAGRIADCTARLCYERCLKAFGEMDDACVLEALSEWTDSASDHAWRVRKAAVLAELGEVREATAIVEQTLSQLRIGLRHSTDEIPALSREGWAMLLLNNLNYNTWLKSQSASSRRPDYRGRWQQLASYGCNPWPELELFEAELVHPAPASTPRVNRIGVISTWYVYAHRFTGGRSLSSYPRRLSIHEDGRRRRNTNTGRRRDRKRKEARYSW